MRATAKYASYHAIYSGYDKGYYIMGSRLCRAFVGFGVTPFLKVQYGGVWVLYMWSFVAAGVEDNVMESDGNSCRVSPMVKEYPCSRLIVPLQSLGLWASGRILGTFGPRAPRV